MLQIINIPARQALDVGHQVPVRHLSVNQGGLGVIRGSRQGEAWCGVACTPASSSRANQGQGSGPSSA